MRHKGNDKWGRRPISAYLAWLACKLVWCVDHLALYPGNEKKMTYKISTQSPKHIWATIKSLDHNRWKFTFFSLGGDISTVPGLIKTCLINRSRWGESNNEASFSVLLKCWHYWATSASPLQRSRCWKSRSSAGEPLEAAKFPVRSIFSVSFLCGLMNSLLLGSLFAQVKITGTPEYKI